MRSLIFEVVSGSHSSDVLLDASQQIVFNAKDHIEILCASDVDTVIPNSCQFPDTDSESSIEKFLNSMTVTRSTVMDTVQVATENHRLIVFSTVKHFPFVTSNESGNEESRTVLCVVGSPVLTVVLYL